MPVISVTHAQADDPIYNSGVTMTFINHSEPRVEKVFDLVDVYRRNRFLIKDNSEDIWFGIEEQIDKKYFEIPFAIVTAWNPMNERYSKEANIWLNNKLEEQIKSQKYAYDYTVGECDGHSEDSFIVYRISKREALKLVLEFRQYSIFYNDTRSLEYIECKTENILLKSNISGTIFEEAYVPKYFSFDEMASAEVIIETLKENNCICPQATHWNRLWERLRDSNVPKPLILAAWHTTSDADKQARFFEHIRYAQEHRRLSSIVSYMNRLETDQWYISI